MSFLEAMKSYLWQSQRGARDLEHDPGPVDGVHGAQAELPLEIQVSEELLKAVSLQFHH